MWLRGFLRRLAAMIVKEFQQLAARPADLRHDARRADHAAAAVRLRHQHRPAAPADRGRLGRRQRRSPAPSSRRCEHRLHDLHPAPAHRGRGQRAAAARRGAVRRHHPGRLHAPAGARRAPADADRGRRHRSAGRRQSAGRRRSPAIEPGADARPDRPAGVGSTPKPGAGRAGAAAPLQPRGHDALQHRARPARRDPHHDHGDDDRAGRHPRARARHDGEPARHAGAAARGDDRQDRALHRHRLGAGRS